MKAASYDAIVIGTGQSGPYVTSRLAAAGVRVAVIERKVFATSHVIDAVLPGGAVLHRERVARPRNSRWVQVARDSRREQGTCQYRVRH